MHTPMLTVTVDIFSEEEGQWAANFTAPRGSALVEKYGDGASALAACREILIEAINTLIRESGQEAT